LTTARFEERLGHCRRHLENYARYTGRTASGITAFDLGTGWHPVVPVGLYCCGADLIWTCDISPLLRYDRVRMILSRFVEYHDRGILAEKLPGYDARRIEKLREVAADLRSTTARQLLQPLGIKVLVQDARRTDLQDESVDLVVSVVSLEYISESVLPGVLEELRRVLATDGVLSCSIDLADQYAYFDPSISPFNFLKFSDWAWNWINNRIIPLSRLRVADYRRHFADAGFQIVEESPRCGRREDLERVKLAPRFEQYSVEDLLVVLIWFAARRCETDRLGDGGRTDDLVLESG
jgi:SAM-dependent methyltransferase